MSEVRDCGVHVEFGPFPDFDCNEGEPPDETGIVRFHGLDWHVTALGYGVVLKQAGIFTIDLSLLPGDPFVSAHGVSDVDFGVLCSVLA